MPRERHLVRATLYSLSILLAVSTQGHAQVIPRQGDNVRLRVERSWTTGEYQGAAANQVRLKFGPDSTLIDVSRNAISEIEVSLGRRRQFARKLGITLTTTAVLGAAIGVVAWSPCEDTGLNACLYSPRSRGESLVGGAIVGGILGLPLGILIGLQHQEEWVSAVLPETGTSRIRAGPFFGDGVGISGSLTIQAF